MKVLLYSRGFLPTIGGAERFAETLAQGLAEAGHRVTVATRTWRSPGQDRDRAYPVLGELPIADLTREAGRHDLVHLNDLGVRAMLVAMGAGRPAIASHMTHKPVCPTGFAFDGTAPCPAGPAPGPCAGCLGRSPRARATLRVVRGTAALVRANVCISHDQQRRLGLPRSRMIYLPVAARAFAARSDGPGSDGLVAFAGRLVPEKGLELLLHALARLPGARLEVLGRGPVRPRLERLIAELGLGERVRLAGPGALDDVIALYARAAVVCVPSTWDEPFGYAAAEAMAMGRAVVATPRGALVELLDDGRGFIADSATPAALAAGLATALGDEAARREAGRRAARFADAELTSAAVVARYEQAYIAALGGARTPRDRIRGGL